MSHEDTEFEDPDYISKSQRKRDVEALQAMGTELVKLSTDRIKKLDLPEDLRMAVLECQRITSHGALRRQMQFIGKLMRNVDPEPIAEQLAEVRGESDVAKARFHDLERWRTRLLEDDKAVTEWLNAHPDSDAQQIRQLIRNARKEAELGKPPKSSRELFRLLRETD
ncbi:MAG: ribosome biogenesis factor YjgA [Gallionellaceae bacterium]|nr:ribosome biogenesis factor YjgA [Gallionellaceae bacterium]MDD5366266.1 ribosome biogenesis factor YjgA [Gallionellaceae bacterium]